VSGLGDGGVRVVALVGRIHNLHAVHPAVVATTTIGGGEGDHARDQPGRRDGTDDEQRRAAPLGRPATCRRRRRKGFGKSLGRKNRTVAMRAKPDSAIVEIVM
jgi:hypothetical protein